MALTKTFASEGGHLVLACQENIHRVEHILRDHLGQIFYDPLIMAKNDIEELRH
jgi:hypothetical protein